jgi:hypothetical protein
MCKLVSSAARNFVAGPTALQDKRNNRDGEQKRSQPYILQYMEFFVV